MRNLEHKEATDFMKWVKFQLNVFPELDTIYHIPNGGHRSIVVGRKLKDEGVKAGMPDYHLPVSRNGYHSLYIELKAKGGRATKTQKEVHEKLRAHNNDVRVCVGWYACAEAVKDYLGVSK